MIFTLNDYVDLGKCSYGTLMESYDTEKNEIYLDEKKVEIKTVEDLFPYLWRSAYASYASNDKRIAMFSSASKTTHWHNELDDTIERCHNKIEKLRKKLDSSKAEAHLKTKLRREYEYEINSCQNFVDIVNRNDKEMKKQQTRLVEENKINQMS